jgi:hypothetical protein
VVSNYNLTLEHLFRKSPGDALIFTISVDLIFTQPFN